MDAVLNVLAKIGFDWQVALANLVNFLIIFFLLKRFAFGPIQRLIEDRQRHIREGLDNRDRADAMVREAEESAQAINMHARGEANAIVAQAHERGADVISAAERTAQERAEAIARDAQKTIQQERDAALREVAKASSALVVDAVEKIIDQDVDASVKEAAVARIAATAHTEQSA